MIGLADLSPREREYAEMVAMGYRTNTIARVMGIAPKTAATYHANVLAKLYPDGLAQCWHPRTMIIRWYWNQVGEEPPC